MKQIISRVLLGLAAVLWAGTAAGAAGINSAEQKVLDEISRPFSYNGKTYVVSSGSIAAAKAKLSEEGMELEDGFANDCISQFHQSYQELVSGGYCTEQEGSGDDSTDAPDATPEPKHSKSERKKNKEFLDMIFGSPEESASPDGESSGEDGSGKAGKSQKKDETPKEAESTPVPTPDEWAYEENTLSVMEFDKRDVANAVENRLTVARGSRKINIQKEDGKPSAQKHIKKYLSAWKKALLCVFIYTAIVFVWAGYYIFGYSGRYNRKRGGRRPFTVMAGICTGAWSFLLLFALGLNFGVFNERAINRQLMESNYFSGVTQMARRQAAEWLQDSGYDSGIADEVFDLSNVYIEEKQYIEAVLSGDKDAEVSVDKIHEKLTERLDEDKEGALISLIEEEYRNISDFELGSIIRSAKESCKVFFRLTVISGIAVILILFALLYFIHGHLDKAAGVTVSGGFAASLLVAAASFAAKFAIAGRELKTTPVYYGEFLQNYLGWSIHAMFYLGCIGTVCAFGLLLWRIHMHKIYEG